MGPTRLSAIRRSTRPRPPWPGSSGCARGGRHAVAALGPQPTRLVSTWFRQARDLDPAEMWGRLIAAGIGVTLRLGGLPTGTGRRHRAARCLRLGSPEVITGPRVAIVGTWR